MTDASKNAALQAKYPPVPIQSREYWETPSSSRLVLKVTINMLEI
jgi:hypothetical protein